jgi:Thioredoxin
MKIPSTQTLIYVALFIVGAALIYMWSRSCGMGAAEGFADADYEFVMYGVDWCPHCQHAKPEFSALGSTKTIGGKTVVCRIVNPEKDGPVTCGGKVDGYPTIRLCRAGSLVSEYSGPRKTAGFLQFLEKNVA